MRALAAAIAAVLLAGVIAALAVAGRDEPLDVAAAERCGTAIANDLGMDPGATAAVEVDDLLRVSVATGRGVLVIDVRQADGRVLDVSIVVPGGSQRLDRESRLRVFEHDC